MTNTLPSVSGSRTTKVAPAVSEANIRRRSGAAYVRLPATVERLAAILGLQSHASIVQRRQGLGYFANSLIEVGRLERAGVDTAPLLEAFMSVQLDARRGTAQVCPLTLVWEEDEAERVQMETQSAWLTGRGSLQAYRDALVSYIARAARTVRLLPQDGAR